MDKRDALQDLPHPPVHKLFVAAIALQNGGISVGVTSDSSQGDSHHLINQVNCYFSPRDLTDVGYPKTGQAQSNAIYWALKNTLAKDSKFQRGDVVELWLCDQFAFGQLTDDFDVMQACIDDSPRNHAIREFLCFLALLRHKEKITFKVGNMTREDHPGYRAAVVKIPHSEKPVLIGSNIRKKETRILVGSKSLQNLGETACIGGDSLLLKTKYAHLVPQEENDLTFLEKLEDAKPVEHTSGDVVPLSPSPKKITYRRDIKGRTSLEFFTEFQSCYPVFEFLGRMGIKFFGRIRDQNSPEPIEDTTWDRMDNPRISVHWGGSYGHKMGGQHAGPFDSFQDALIHALWMLDLDPQDFVLPNSPEILAGRQRLYQGVGSAIENNEYLVVETVRRHLHGSNLLDGRSLSEADVSRLEATLRQEVKTILEPAEDTEEAEPEGEVKIGHADDALHCELHTLDDKIQKAENAQHRYEEINAQIEDLQSQLAQLSRELQEIGEPVPIQKWVARRDKIVKFLELE